jgi:hypothetical protein
MVHLTLGSLNSAYTQLGDTIPIGFLTTLKRGRDRLSATKNDYSLVKRLEVTSTIQYVTVQRIARGPDSKVVRRYTLVKGRRTCS